MSPAASQDAGVSSSSSSPSGSGSPSGIGTTNKRTNNNVVAKEGDSFPMKINENSLSIAILGGGIAGLSCASQLLTRHKKQSASSSYQYKLEVTVFDTGRLRPGGRCSSRLPADYHAVSSSSSPPSSRPVLVVEAVEDARGSNHRRPCDNNDASNDDIMDTKNNAAQIMQSIPVNIQKAINNNNGMSVATKMGAVDHAAQILWIRSCSSSLLLFDEFRTQLQSWLDDGIIEEFPIGSVCELVSINNNNNDHHHHDATTKTKSMLSSVDEKEMFYGKGGMASIPIAMREHCLSFSNDEWSSFRIMQDVWVSPSNGVKYITGTKNNNNNDGVNIQQHDDDEENDLRWELWAGKKSLGKYHRLVIAHNGKCGKLFGTTTCCCVLKCCRTPFHSLFVAFVLLCGAPRPTLLTFSLPYFVLFYSGSNHV